MPKKTRLSFIFRAAHQPLGFYTKYLLVLTLIAAMLTSCSSQPAVQATPAPTPTTLVDLPTPTVLVPSPSPFPYTPAIYVGDRPVYQPEIDFAVRQIESAIAQLPGQTLSPEQMEILAVEDLIDQELLAQGAFEAGFEINDQDINGYKSRLIANTGQYQVDSWVADHMASQDLFEYALRRAIAAAWMRDFITSGLQDEIEQVRARQVLVETLEAAQQIIAQSNQPGIDFTSTAYQYDPYTGGDLGWIAPGTTFFPQIESAVFAIQDPSSQPILPEPIETELGYHVIQVLDRETRPLARFQRLRYQQKELDQWLLGQRSALPINYQNVSGGAAPALITLTPVDQAPVYPVQEGDNYYAIAKKFRLPFQALIDANPNYPPEYLSTQAEIVIPGLSGWQGQVGTVVIPAGTDLLAYSRAWGIDPFLLARLNRLTSPVQLTYGNALVMPEETIDGLASLEPQPISGLSNGQSLLEYAVTSNLTPWELALTSGVTSPNRILPGQSIFSPDSNQHQTLESSGIDLASITLVQGQTTVIQISSQKSESQPSGTLDGIPLHFFSTSSGWVALQGMPAMAYPGTALINLSIQPPGRSKLEFEQPLTFYPGEFLFDPPLTVDPATIDPGITAPEEQQISDLTSLATPQRHWSGPFMPPVDSPGCTRSLFGNRRSFNGSPYTYFHSGLDYGVCGSDRIFAPAAGKVVFTSTLDVRGNATLIDHGWGVYSGFWHQSEILVRVGDVVSAGQVIGTIGATGRITGEHLHWELWVGGVQVDPMQWLEQTIP